MRISDWSSDVCSSDLRCDRADYQEWPRHHGGRGGSGDELMATNGDLTDEDRLPWLETVDEDYEAGQSGLRIAALVILGLALNDVVAYAVSWTPTGRKRDEKGKDQSVGVVLGGGGFPKQKHKN